MDSVNYFIGYLLLVLLLYPCDEANGLSQRNVLKLKQHQQQHRQSTTSHLVNNNKDNVLSGCQTQTNIEMNIQPSDLYHLDAPTAVEDDDSFSRNKDLTNVIVHAKLVNTADEKPCGQSTYNQLRRYKDCGLQDTKALLPVFVRSSDDLDTKVVTRRVTPRGSLDYIFDGGTAVRYPSKRLPKNWWSEYSISGWLYVKPHHERQYIVSWSDGDSMSRTNMGLYARRNHNSITFGFTHTHKIEEGDEEREEKGRSCILTRKWKNEKRNTRWIFFALTFTNCNVELQLDGKTQTVHSSRAHLHAPERHLQPKFVIGARWVGSAVKYADFFNGLISGLVITTDSASNALDQNGEKLKCIFKCAEHVSISLDADQHEATLSSSPKKQQSLKLRMNYTNTNLMPMQSQRQLMIFVRNPPTSDSNKETSNPSSLSPESLSSSLSYTVMTVCTSREKAKLEISGDCTHDVLLSYPSLSSSPPSDSSMHQNQKQRQFRICSSRKDTPSSITGRSTNGEGDLIKSYGCLSKLDSLTITLVEPIQRSSSKTFSKSNHEAKGGKLHIPVAYLNRYGMSSTHIDGGGLLVHGVTNTDDYNRVLRQVRFTPSKVLEGDQLKHTFEVVATSYNGLIRSNVFQIHINLMKDNTAQDIALAQNRALFNTRGDSSSKNNNGISYGLNHHLARTSQEDDGKDVNLMMLPEGVNHNKVFGNKKKYDGGEGTKITLVLCIGAVVGLVMLLPVAVFVVTKKRSMDKKTSTTHQSTMTTIESLPNSSTESHHHQAKQQSHNHHHHHQVLSTVFFVDDGGNNPTIRINPSARVSISNDPLKDLLLKKSSISTSASSTDPTFNSNANHRGGGGASSFSEEGESTYSDDDDEESEFDNDSIRQLEWDSLEKDLTNVLNGVDDRSSTCSRIDCNKDGDDDAFFL